MSGFVALHREAREHHLFKGDVARLGAWLWLVAGACWKPTKFNIGGSTITLQRGQICVSVRQLAEAWGWSKSAVDRFLTRLQTETMIVCEAGQGRTIITICNYAKYQDQEERDRDSSGTPSGTAAGQQRDTKEQGNKETRLEIEANASIAQNEVSGGDDDPVPVDLFGEPDLPPEPELRPEHVVEVWNELATEIGRPKVRDLTPERRQQLKARIAGYSIDDFTDAISRIRRSPFLRGERGWAGVTFDWLIKKSNFQKIIEGNYDGQPAQGQDRGNGSFERRYAGNR